MKRTSTRLMAVGAVAGLVVLSACGSDGNDEGSADEPATTEAAADTTEADDMADEPGTIVDVAVANGSFATLVAAVTAADLGETLTSDGPFTVFAPTDDAFAALPDGLVDCLLLEENLEPLQSILTYHVVSGEVLSTDLTDGVVLNDSANVVIADVPASNGVIHAIDAVIVPPSIDVAAFLETCPA